MSRIVVRQFLLVIALFVLYWMITSYHYVSAHPHFAERAGGLLPSLLYGIPKAILFALPIATGVSLSLLPDGRGAFRAALLVAGGVTALLVLNDLLARPFWDAVEHREMGTDDTDTRPPRFDDTTSALGGSLAHLLGRVRPEDLQPWPPPPSSSTVVARITDPVVIIRLSAVQKYSRALELFVPLLLGGLVAGLGTWLRRVATFRTPRDERVLRLVLGWLLTLVVVYGLGVDGGSMYTLTSPRASLGWMLLPYLFAAIPAAIGWRALHRLDQLAGA